MNTSFYDEALNRLLISLKVLEGERIDVVEKSELAINECLKIRDEIKSHFKEYQPKNQEEEIYFFKHVKPLFVEHLIYHLKVYYLERGLLLGCAKAKKSAYCLELKKTKSFLNQNSIFYTYYKTNSTHLDYKYFVRGNQDIKLQLSTNAFEFDPEFSTGNDFLVAKIKASEKLQIYLENKLAPNTCSLKDELPPIKISENIKWTGSKVALIELVYALHAVRVINNGEAEIKDIAKLVENLFNINLGDYYHTYAEIRIRKKGRTKFLDKLKARFITKMGASDEEY